MKEVVILSGKGGTGKTSIAASFAFLAGKEAVVADCDVDAANMHLLLKPDFKQTENFHSGELAVIDPGLCTECGKCLEVCRFNAILVSEAGFSVSDHKCEGCGYCARVCDAGAITNRERLAGKLFKSNIKTGSLMVHARLGIGAENSGKLVAEVKKEARKIALERNAGLLIVDGSPGIGCPVISAISGADLVLLVVEPTISGYHDFIRIYELTRSSGIKACCIVNKCDLNEDIAGQIIEYCKMNGVRHISSIPFSKSFTAAMTLGLTVTEYANGEMKELLSDSWGQISGILQNQIR